MASFFVFSNSTVAQALTAGQNGMVATTGTIYVETAAAITMTGATDLTVMGTVASSTLQAVALTSMSGTVTVGAAGSLVSSSASAISGTFTSDLAIVNAGLISGNVGIAIGSTGVSTFTLNNQGSILSYGTFSADAVTGTFSGFVRASNDGVVRSSGGTAFNLSTNAFVLDNTGVVSGLSQAIRVDDRLFLKNTGTIEGAIDAGGASEVTNTGTILGTIRLSDAADKVRNAGLVEGDLTLGAQSDSLVNSGTLRGNVFAGDGNDMVDTGGVITGQVDLGAGNDTLIATGGTIRTAVAGGSGDDTFFVDDSRLVIVDASGLDRVFSTVNFRLSAGIEVLELQGPDGLRGTGNTGAEFLAGTAGYDTLRGLEGNDTLEAAAGDNVAKGGAGNDILGAGDGDDLLLGGDGDDQIKASLGNDTLNGGGGSDTLNLITLGGPGAVNLGAGQMTFGAHVSTLVDIENVDGGGFGDTILGGSGDNLLRGNFGNDSMTGGGGADRLEGGQGDDVLSGEAGNDVLVGLIGSDSLQGGFGVDTFVYQAVSDSDGTAFTDTITGFQTGFDIIDLSLLDANGATAGDQAFAFLGVGTFSGAGQEVRLAQDTLAGTTVVEIRLAGSVVNDMEIVLATANLALTAANFSL